ncbi:diguanylate cyclase (GGDEF) domain-containing protein [Carboxydocella sporoproducens DSM 16521]|uniref:histidine kinase n=2 Tax=Carboxydocella TaxID=178898 RepID=A0A1T4S2S0_9FIRM|nr:MULTISPECIES: ATP-binding protein [Carboxydocella]AVX20661.1 diguanylate cyclase (GGDEF) domain-containing protein [Carboxydocella thermautotrophica]AVX31083.1 diguanylate cyclase (GGDEF) domain-containing protein [Carboxydocella thermautotrophica]GAW28195.1 hypothetical protein ULO1_07650 [Carboxydocella sp. ULO1]SKA22610.1 diguanylate cyclase (GGDEF) domain-containing protein [Carboxydocella sporoproducens DSM 16521]
MFYNQIIKLIKTAVYLLPVIILFISHYITINPILHILIWEMFALPVYFLLCENKSTLAIYLIILSTAGIIIEIINYYKSLDIFSLCLILLIHILVVLINSIAALNYNQVLQNQIKLQERLKRLAIIDPLTHLINGKYFLMKLDEEISRAKRENKKFTVAVYKIVNLNKLESGVRNGCLEWNLTRIAEILRQTIRNFDTVARLKDDVFAVLLTNSDLEQAHEIKERFEKKLQENVNTRKWKFSGYSQHDNLYVLAGYAVYPKDHNEGQGLLEVAEQNLEVSEKNYKYKVTQDWLKSERYALMEQMSASLAHEIKNPLTSVRGFIQLLQNREQDFHEKEHLRIILDELDRMNKLIHEFLSFSTKKNTRKFFDINQLIDDIIFIMSSLVHDKNIKIEKRSELKNSLLYGQPEKIKQVFINLIRNSIEAINCNGKITIILQEDGNYLLMSVKDNGCGIDRETIKNIFKPFYTTKETGTGLGLSISAQIIKEHQGEIWVDSERGIGTTFKIKLPRN